MQNFFAMLPKTAYTPLWLADIIKNLGIPAVAVAAVLITWYLVQMIAHWKIFNKAGAGAWKSVIPIVNGFTQLKFSWGKAAGWVMLAFVLMTFVPDFVSGFSWVMYIYYVGFLGAGVMNIIASCKLAKCFGRKFGFTLGLLFFSPIFMLVLGLGPDEFVGKKGEKAE